MLSWVDLDYFDMFFEESSENLNFLEELIDKIDNEVTQGDLDHLFRIFHSLKGIAGMMGFMPLNDANHLIENKLKTFTFKNRVEINELKSWLTESRDYLQDMVSDIAEAVENQSEKAPDLDHYFEKIKAISTDSDLESSVIADDDISTGELRLAIEEYFESLDVSIENEDLSNIKTTLHTMKGDLGTFDKSELVTIIHNIEDIIDQDNTIIKKYYSQIKDCILENIQGENTESLQFLNDLVYGQIVKQVSDGFITKLQTFIKLVTDCLKTKSNKESEITNLVEDIVAYKSEYKLEDLFATFEACSMVGWSNVEDNLFIKDLIREIKLVISLRLQKDTVEKETPVTPQPELQKPEVEESIPKKKKKTVVQNKEYFKIDSRYIDELMDISGEFVVAKNILMHNYKELLSFNRKEAKKLEYVIKTIKRLSDGLQDNVLQMRLVPCKEVFKKAPKIVRDISRKLEKDIELIIEGEDTEIDKTIGEKVSDALLHIVRNSCDHGIESEEVRLASGKSPKGKIVIKAFYEQSFLKIQISDDGGGINTERVKEKVLEKNVLSKEILNTYSNDDLAYLIFHPGLSTAETVSDISGRGVGMDVVKTNIEQLGGHIELTTTHGEGSIFSLYIPLSTSIKKSLIATYQNEKIAVAVDQIVETIKVDNSKIFERFRENYFSYRNTIVKVLNYGPSTKRLPFIIFKHRDHFYAFQVTNFIGHEDLVIKEPNSILKRYKNVIGMSVLGDGAAVLVLDLISYLERKPSEGSLYAA